MKKIFTLIMLLAIFSSSTIQAQQTRQYASDDIATLITDLDAAVDGDIFELTTSGGVYVFADYMKVNADIIVRAADGLVEKPVLKRGGGDYIARIYGDTTNVELYGLKFDGEGSAKYAIRTAKPEDNITYEYMTTNDTAGQIYSLIIDDCDFTGIGGTSAIYLYPGTTATLLKVTNSTFSEIARSAIDGTVNSSPRDTYGCWTFADSMVIENTTFSNIKRDAIWITTLEDAPSAANKVNINHCTFDNVGYDGASDKYHVLETDYATNYITNCTFTNDVTSTDYIAAIKVAESFVDYNGFYNNPLLEKYWNIANSPNIGVNEIVAASDVYTDQPNGDFTLVAGAAFLAQASDGYALGDLNNAPAADLAAYYDVTLYDLLVDGTTIADFDATTLTYTLKLGVGETVVPTVTAEANSATSTYVITDATTIPGTTTVVVTSAGGTTQTYTINFILPSDDATLVDLTVGGETINNFDAATLEYTYELPYGSVLADVPDVAGTATDEVFATVTPNQATAFPGDATIVVLAEDDVTSLTYIVHFIETPNNDTRLSDITVNGVSIEGFDKDVDKYEYVLPFGTTEIATVDATTNDPQASKEITLAPSVEGDAIIVVTAKDGISTQTHTVSFVIAPDTTATLSDLSINDETIAGFDSAIYVYDVVLAKGTLVAPDVIATTFSDVATLEMVSATTLPGMTKAIVTAEDGITTLTYTVNFTVMPYEDDSSLSDLTVDGITISGFAADKFDYAIELAWDATDAPLVAGTANGEFATVVPNQATALPGDATIVVKAENGNESTYTVKFTLGKEPEATYMVTFNVTGADDAAVEGAEVMFNGVTLKTDMAGVAEFEQVSAATGMAYSVAMANYETADGTVDVVDKDVEVNVTLMPVGINQNDVLVANLYPNPTNGKVYFELNSDINNAKLTVTDISGKVIDSRQLTQLENTIDLSENVQGVYFITISSDNQIYQGKIILK